MTLRDRSGTGCEHRGLKSHNKLRVPCTFLKASLRPSSSLSYPVRQPDVGESDEETGPASARDSQIRQVGTPGPRPRGSSVASGAHAPKACCVWEVDVRSVFAASAPGARHAGSGPAAGHGLAVTGGR